MKLAEFMWEAYLVKRLSHLSTKGWMTGTRTPAENGQLGQTVKVFGKLKDRRGLSYAFGILEGLDVLYRSDVVHEELKAANILTTKTSNVKLCHFGVSLNLSNMEHEIKDVAGIPNRMARDAGHVRISEVS